MFILGVILFILVPVLELAVIIKVGSVIGVLPTIGLLLLDSLLGVWLLRHQGRASWRRFNASLRTGRPPTTEVIDGALVILGGALLLTPGFITDFMGFALLVPPTRAAVRVPLVTLLSRRLVVRAGTTAYAGAGHVWRRRRDARRPYDVDGSAVDADSARLST